MYFIEDTQSACKQKLTIFKEQYNACTTQNAVIGKESRIYLNHNQEEYIEKVVGIFMMLDQDIQQIEDPDISPSYMSLKIPLIDVALKGRLNHPNYFKPHLKKGRIRLINVFKEERGKGLMGFLFEAFDAVARVRGFDSIYSIVTCPATFKAAHKFGYEKLAQVYLKDYPQIKDHYSPPKSIIDSFGGEEQSIKYVAKFLHQ